VEWRVVESEVMGGGSFEEYTCATLCTSMCNRSRLKDHGASHWPISLLIAVSSHYHQIYTFLWMDMNMLPHAWSYR
jgi:hypothetical protein